MGNSEIKATFLCTFFLEGMGLKKVLRGLRNLAPAILLYWHLLGSVIYCEGREPVSRALQQGCHLSRFSTFVSCPNEARPNQRKAGTANLWSLCNRDTRVTGYQAMYVISRSCLGSQDPRTKGCPGPGTSCLLSNIKEKTCSNVIKATQHYKDSRSD